MKRALVTAGLVVAALAVGGVATEALLPWGSTASTKEQTKQPPATALVTRMTLVETKTLWGTLGYGDPVPVSAFGQGTLTEIALAGSTVERGGTLFKIDQLPVVSLYGAVPSYRPLAPGVVGDDVKQFEENLVALGYKGFIVDDTFTETTATAVRAWQAKLGLTVTGTVEPGQVVYTPGPVRIASQVARVGQPVGRGEGGGVVLTYTGTTRLVTIDLKVVDQALAVKGGKVTITIPGGAKVDGTISNVGTVAAQAPGTESSSGQPPPAADARITVTVTIADQKSLGTLEAAPVDVDFVTGKRDGVLTVPVAALLALPEGGYGVEVVESDGTTRIVAVTTGLFAAGRVEITGGDITEGMKVGVPK